MTEKKKSPARAAVERLVEVGADPAKARAELEQSLRAEGLDDEAIARELAMVERTLGI